MEWSEYAVFAETDAVVRVGSDGAETRLQAVSIDERLHLARKAFYPALPPFPLLHVATTFRTNPGAGGGLDHREGDRRRLRRLPREKAAKRQSQLDAKTSWMRTYR